MRKAMFAVAVATVATTAMAMPVAKQQGTLRLADTGRDGRAEYVCTLQGENTTYEVRIAFDPAAKQLVAHLAYPLTLEKGQSARFTGPYAETEEKNEGKATTTTYTLASGSYEFNLTYTEGATLPVFTFGAGLKGYACH